MKKILLVIILSLITSEIITYNNDYFTISFPKYLSETKEENNNYIWSNDSEYLSVTISDNIEHYNISKLTQKELDKQKEYIINTYKEKLNDYNTEVTLDNMYLNKENTLTYLEYDLHLISTKDIGHDIYQKCRMYTTDNYVYSVLYSNEIPLTLQNIKVLDSFKVKDNYLKNINYVLYIVLLIVSLILVFIVNYLIQKRRQK